MLVLSNYALRLARPYAPAQLFSDMSGAEGVRGNLFNVQWGFFSLFPFGRSASQHSQSRRMNASAACAELNGTARSPPACYFCN